MHSVGDVSWRLLLCLLVSAHALMASAALTVQQHQTIDQLTSCFENSTPVMQYRYCENIHDGRGITAGRAGFCSGTWDMKMVVERYNVLAPGNPLSSLLPALRAIDGTPNTAGLETLCAKWQTAADTDPRFRQAQDDISNQLYFTPAMNYANNLRLTLPLSIGQIYDCSIQHGDGPDVDGVGSIIRQTTQAMGGTPATGVDEKAWMNKFIANRRLHLMNAADPATREPWRGSVDRVDCYARIAASGNWMFNLPMQISAYGDPFTLVATPGAETYSWSVGTPGTCSCSGSATRSVVCKSSSGATVADSSCSSTTKPSTSVQCTAPASCYQWKLGAWSPCSSDCTSVLTPTISGTQTASVTCVQSASGVNPGATVTNTALCTASKPATQRACATQLCPTAWRSSGWSACSTSCGSGTQTQSATCTQTRDGQQSVVPDAFCTGTKPPTQQACPNLPPCPTYAWTTGAFGACPVSCGSGTQTRRVSCTATPGGIVADSFCATASKPTSTQTCFSGSQCHHWKVGVWSLCDSTCEGGIQTAPVTCVQSMTNTAPGAMVANSLCAAVPMPFSTRTCNTQACPTAWVQDGWSGCSATCGGGFQTRTVTCGKTKDAAVSTVADSQCAGTKPPTSQECNTEVCLDGQYEYSQWSACSVSCGGGTQTRTQTCVAGGQVQSDNARCSTQTPLPTQQTCNTDTCPPPPSATPLQPSPTDPTPADPAPNQPNVPGPVSSANDVVMRLVLTYTRMDAPARLDADVCASITAATGFPDTSRPAETLTCRHSFEMRSQLDGTVTAASPTRRLLEAASAETDADVEVTVVEVTFHPAEPDDDLRAQHVADALAQQLACAEQVDASEETKRACAAEVATAAGMRSLYDSSSAVDNSPLTSAYMAGSARIDVASSESTPTPVIVAGRGVSSSDSASTLRYALIGGIVGALLIVGIVVAILLRSRRAQQHRAVASKDVQVQRDDVRHRQIPCDSPDVQVDVREHAMDTDGADPSLLSPLPSPSPSPSPSPLASDRLLESPTWPPPAALSVMRSPTGSPAPPFD